MEVSPTSTERLTEQIRAELRQRGYYVMNAEELAQVWRAENSATGRGAALADFACALGAAVSGWHEKSALLRIARKPRA